MNSGPLSAPEWAQAILRGAGHLVIATDLQGVVTWFNPAAETRTGYTAAEIVGKQTPALWHDRQEVIKRAEQLSTQLGRPIEPGFDVFVAIPRQAGSETREWSFIRKDGGRFPGRLTVTCVKDGSGEAVGYLGVIEDVTVPNAVRTRLEDALAFLDLMGIHNPDYVFVKDREFRIVEANPAFLSLYPEAERGRVIGYTTVEEYPPEQAEAFLAKDREAFEQGTSRVMERITFPDGETRLLDTKKVRFENAKGEPFILGIARDQTERENLIAKLRESNEELEEFAYRTSHDLRSPLVSSIALLRLARRAIDRGDHTQVAECIGHVEESLTKLERLVEDILVLSQTRQQEESAEPVDLPQVVAAALDKLAYLDGFSRLEIRQEFAAGDPVMLPPSRIRLIIENLISNAIKYQNPKEARPFVLIRCQTEGGTVDLSVSDNGIGVPPDQRAKLFGMFKRLHSRVSFGSGLGLYMVRKSARLLGGDAVFEDPGTGSRFRVTLPNRASALPGQPAKDET